MTTFKPALPDEIRRSGWAMSMRNGYTEPVMSCSNCANVVRVPWQPAFFEGQCAGCEVALSGFPIEG